MYDKSEAEGMIITNLCQRSLWKIGKHNVQQPNAWPYQIRNLFPYYLSIVDSFQTQFEISTKTCMQKQILKLVDWKILFLKHPIG